MRSGAGLGTTRRWPVTSPKWAGAGPGGTGRRARHTSMPANPRPPGMRCGRSPEDLTERQSAKVSWITKTDPAPIAPYLLKEGLRHHTSSSSSPCGITSRTAASTPGA